MKRQFLFYERLGVPVFACLENGLLTEYQEGETSSAWTVGSILLGSVVKVDPKLKAAFVNIGGKNEAFLPLDARPLEELQPGMELAVQIRRLPEGHKGAMVTDEISLRGPKVVLSYGDDRLGISKKIIDEEERKRLRRIALDFPSLDHTGYVVRTESEGAKREDLVSEAEDLAEQYRKLRSLQRFSRIGTVLYKEDSFWTRILLSYPISQVDEIVCEGSAVYEEISDALRMHSVSNIDKIKKYTDPSFSLADLYKLPSQIEEAQKKTVYLKNGGYLYIEKTEALISIDVNTGMEKGQGDKERFVTDFNLSAIPDIVRQIRLRDLGGIILVDFINMQLEEDQKKVTEAFIQEMAKDRRAHHVYGLTHLQLMEISRNKI